MREMKNSGVEWIGEIPNSWNVSKIGSIYEERNIKVSDNDYQPLSVTKKGIVPQLETAAKTDNGDNRKLILKNDFVINSRSDRRGSCGISEYDGSCSLINTVLKPRNNMCNSYFNLVFHSERFADEFYKYGNGIVDDLWSTKWSNMKSIYIPFPPLPEQHRIAAYLDDKCSKIDNIIEKQQQVIEKLKEYKLSVITEAITVNNRNKMKLKKIITSIEQGWSPAPSERQNDNGWKVITLAAIKAGRFVNGDFKPFDGKETRCDLLRLKNDDFLLTRSNTRNLVGQACLVQNIEENVIFSDLVYRLSFNEKMVFKSFMVYIFQSAFMRQQIERDAHGSSNTMVKITHKDIENWDIVLPDFEEQKSIADYLDKKCLAIETAISKKQAIIDKLAEYKKSLIYEVVTGKKEV